jgi:23S rRNA pseudouridine1911/1915/1917 synthase
MTNPIQLLIPQEYEGKRIDSCAALIGMSRSAFALLCEKGVVFINGLPAEKNLKVRTGDLVVFERLEPADTAACAQDIPLDIVYEDEHLLVVNKPQGMVVHPAAGNPDKTLVNALLHHCPGNLSVINGVRRPGIVHRIDKDTSGLLVVAKDDATHVGLGALFSLHSIDREYLAVVHGRLKDDAGTIDAPIGRHKTERKRMAVTAHNSKNAVTHYEVLRRFSQYTLVRLRLETGRTHQIRVHMAHIGHPVAGDPVYGPKRGVRGPFGRAVPACRRSRLRPSDYRRVPAV